MVRASLPLVRLLDSSKYKASYYSVVLIKNIKSDQLYWHAAAEVERQHHHSAFFVDWWRALWQSAELIGGLLSAESHIFIHRKNDST